MNHLRVMLLIAALALAGCGGSGQSARRGGLAVILETRPAPPLAGQTSTLVVRLDRSGAPLDGARVTISQQMAGMDHAGEPMLSARGLGDGRYEAQTTFPMGGRWDLRVMVVDRQAVVETFPFQIDVE